MSPADSEAAIAAMTPEERARYDAAQAAVDVLRKAHVPFVMWIAPGDGWWNASQFDYDADPEKQQKSGWKRFCTLLGTALAFHSHALAGHLTEHAPDGSAYMEYRKGAARVLREPKPGEGATKDGFNP